MNEAQMAHERRQRLLAALDNVLESYALLNASFDREVCLDLLEWLRVSQHEIEQWLALSERHRQLH